MLVLAKNIVKDKNVDIRVGLLEQGVNEALSLEKQSEIAAFISRGGTALLLRQAKLQAPLIEIPVTIYDLIQLVAEARKISSKIGVLGFSNMIGNVEELASILGVKLQVFYLDQDDDSIPIEISVEHKMRHMVNQGIEVVIGGVITSVFSAQYSIPSILIKTGKVAILRAVAEAQRIVATAGKEKAKTKQIKTILEFANEGVITTDHKGIVTLCNPSAEKIIGLKPTQILGRPVNKIVQDSAINQVLLTGEKILGELQSFNNTKVVTNNVPIIVNKRIQGVVSTFQKVSEIQEQEQSIRRRLHNRPHRAEFTFDDIIGKNGGLLCIKEDARQFALTESNVLILGETGTGKELFAQAIHNHGKRNKGPFVAINCATLPETLIESELFGYASGAFTGARKEGKPGLFLVANQGTIFLDEVSELPLALQTKLLRVLQEKEIRPIGGQNVVATDIRIVAATNVDLWLAVQKGLFRKDFYFRLNVLNLYIPPLRERPEDIPLLTQHFIEKHKMSLLGKCKITAKALNSLCEHSWPGNIRELENVIQRVILLSADNDGQITSAMVSQTLAGELPCQKIEMQTATGVGAKHIDLSGDLQQMEKQVLLRILEEEDGNQTTTAKRLGISRTHVWRLLKNSEG